MLFAACVLSETNLLDGMPPAKPVASCSAPGKIMQLSQARAAAYVPAVSGDPELDAYLKTVLDGVVGRDGDALRRAYEWLGSCEAFPYEEMDYIDVAAPDGEWSVDCALEMAQRGSGNCYRYAALMSWIARALGYDAEAVSGLVLMADGWAYHASARPRSPRTRSAIFSWNPTAPPTTSPQPVRTAPCTSSSRSR